MKRALVAIVAAMLLAGCESDDCFFHDDWCDASLTGKPGNDVQPVNRG